MPSSFLCCFAAERPAWRRRIRLLRFLRLSRRTTLSRWSLGRMSKMPLRAFRDRIICSRRFRLSRATATRTAEATSSASGVHFSSFLTSSRIRTCLPVDADAALTAPADASDITPAPNQWSTEPGEKTPIHTENNIKLPQTLAGVKATGPMVLMILISRTGVVSDIEPLVTPSPEIAQYAADVMKQWTYKPIVRDGKPIEDITDVFLNIKF